MPHRTDVIYRYDGSYQGFLCCVFQCFLAKELPVAIRPADEAQQSLFGLREVPTRVDWAQRVERSISRKISPEAHRLVREGFLTCLPDREMLLLRFLLLGYRYGARAARMDAHPAVAPLRKGVLSLENEAHRVLEFLRFSDCGEFLAARIAPENRVLPLAAPHFCDRLPGESFVIYDEAHGMGFVHPKGERGEFFQAEGVELPPPSEAESRWRDLWKVFYRTVAVEGRRNPQLRQSLCPKRYWPQMVEMEGQ